MSVAVVVCGRFGRNVKITVWGRSAIGFVARWLARRVWAAMLWWMRRPFVRRLRRQSLALVPTPMRERVRRSMGRQDRFALRVGLRWLEWAFALLLLSVLTTGAFLTVLRLQDAGALSVPERGATTDDGSGGRP